MKSWCWGPPRLWLLDHSWEAQSISSPPAPRSGPRKCPRAHGDMRRPPVTPEAGDSGREQRDIKASAACPTPPVSLGKCLALLCHQFGGHRWRVPSVLAPCPRVHLALGIASFPAWSLGPQCSTGRHVSPDCQRPGGRGA